MSPIRFEVLLTLLELPLLLLRHSLIETESLLVGIAVESAKRRSPGFRFADVWRLSRRWAALAPTDSRGAG